MKKKWFMALTIIMIVGILTGCLDNEKKIQLPENEINYLEEESKVKEENKEVQKDKIETEVISEYANNKNITILIDPGHSKNPSKGVEKISPNGNETKLKDTSGAMGETTRIPEYNIVMDVALKLEKELLNKGYNVFLTRKEVNEALSNIERAEEGNRLNADLVIKLHCDSATAKEAKGASMLIPREKGYITKEVEEKSKEYGKIVLEEYIRETNLNNRGLVYRNDLTGFNWSKVPIILLEMGFLSNKSDELYLTQEESKERIVEGISNGIDKIQFEKK
ncbi:N-acetylmuramoyl-L-alanine amidase [uncultured Clostridium sp.]|uniref:N-acetylmuramoyl-L-alanine amidase family protein n=1 Tax=uncultured Clostridium sp. TaxID=59620 RepID=UPI002605F845|nr:N-acetylmuramoyl-L-alanine amidase [uncultured Clostridium sp.]